MLQVQQRNMEVQGFDALTLENASFRLPSCRNLGAS